MSCVHFKFKSSLNYEGITFEGLHISLSELRDAIMKQKKIGLSNEFKLEVVDAQSKKVYDDDNEMIQRNTSVIVRRVPIPNAPKLPKTQHKDPSLFPQASSGETQRKLTSNELRKVGDLSLADATEEEKLMAMMSQAGEGFDPSQYAKVQRYSGAGPPLALGLRNPPPPNYVCYRCGQKGHWIKFCPTNGNPSFDRLPYRRSAGIPATQISTANPGMPGAMMNRFGELVVRTVDFNAMKSGKVKSKSEALEAPKEVEVPPELTCSLCKELFKDAVIIPCCGESFCDECIREHLLENEFTCPACEQEDVSPDTLAPNKDVRMAAKNFRSKVAEEKSVALARGFVAAAPRQVVLPMRTSLPTYTSVTPLPFTSSAPLRSTRVSTVRSTRLTSSIPTPLPSTSVVTASSQSSTFVTEGLAEKDAKSTSVSLVNGMTTATPKLGTAPVSSETTPPAATEPLPVSTAASLTLPGDKAVPSANGKVARSRSPSPFSRPRSASPVPVVAEKKEQVTMTTASSLKTGTIPLSLAPTLLPPGLLAPAPRLPVLPPALLVNQLAAARGAPPLPLPGLAPVLAGVPVGLIPGLPMAGLPPMAPPQSMAPRPPIPISSSSSKLDRIAADLLLSTATAKPPKSSSPPPLSAEEFYRQQKVLQHIVLKPKKRVSSNSSESHSHSSTSHSRSSTPRSSLSASSGSRSRSRSSSRSLSHARSRSRSRSPYTRSPARSKHRSSRKLKHDRRARYEKEQERERERARHHKRKRKHHESVEVAESRSRKPKRHRSKSPKRKVLPVEPPLSPDITTSTATSENEYRSRRHKHKKKKRRRDRAEEEENEGMEFVEKVLRVEKSVDEENRLDQPEEATVIQMKEDTSTTLPLEADHAETTESVKHQDFRVESEVAAAGKATGMVGVSLVPYHDSSATEGDQRGDDGSSPEPVELEAAAVGKEQEKEEEEEEGEGEEKTLPLKPLPVEEEEDVLLLLTPEDEITLHVDESFEGISAGLGSTQEKTTPTPTLAVQSGQTKEEGELSDSEEETTEILKEETTSVREEDKEEEAPVKEEEEEEDLEIEVEEEVKLPKKSRKLSRSKRHSLASTVMTVKEPLSAYSEESDGNTDTRHRSKKRKHKHKTKDKNEPRRKKASRKHEHELPRKHETKSSKKHKHKKSSRSDRHK